MARFLHNRALAHNQSPDIRQTHQDEQIDVQADAFWWVEDIDRWLPHQPDYSSNLVRFELLLPWLHQAPA